MHPFNLEKFKAGEPAYDKDDNSENFYLADLPDGRIAVSFFNYDKWETFASSVSFLNDEFYMKGKELTWKEVRDMWASDRIDRTLFSEWLDANFEAPKLKKK